MLLLLAADRQRAWTVDQISATLRSSPNSIGERLRLLCEAHLVSFEAGGAYLYAASGRSHDMVLMLQNEYAERRYSVIELVYSRPDPARSFADAFRFKDENDERHG